MDNGTKVCHFIQDIKSTELEAVVNVVRTHPEKYGTDFDAFMSYAFKGKVEGKMHPKAVWNPLTKEQQMQIRKLHEQQDIKPAVNQTSADAMVAALEAKLRINSQPKKGDVNKTKGETP